MAKHDYNCFAPRIAFFTAAAWNASGTGWKLNLTYENQNGHERQVSLVTKDVNQPLPRICIPSGSEVGDIAGQSSIVDTVLLAHFRAATQIAGGCPGSQEWESLFAPGSPSRLKLACGDVSYLGYTPHDDGGNTYLDVQVRQGDTTIYESRLDVGMLVTYDFNPELQYLVVAGAIKTQFPTYAHNPPGDELTEQQRTDISNLLLGTGGFDPFKIWL